MKSRVLALLLITVLCTMAVAQQYVPALPGYQYQFPRDNFNHPEYGTEWWYYTGNVRATDGHRFGFELTFFRQGISRAAATSPWHVNDIYMAHLALSDINGKHYYMAERLNRAGPGIAGVLAPTVWNGNWHTEIEQHAHSLRGLSDDFSFLLQVTPQKAPVIQGRDGISQKAAGTGHASHYISYTRMGTNGTITLHGKRYQVKGDAWMDHEFFSESMSSGEVGWDWLSMQLQDNSELMLYRLRHKDGSVDPYSSGTYIDSEGKPTYLSLGDFAMTARGTTWKSPRTAAIYPVGWSVQIPGLNLQLDITTPLDDQEFVSHFGPSYWEGAIDISGHHGEQAVRGSGYLEMTGYAQPGRSSFTFAPQ